MLLKDLKLLIFYPLRLLEGMKLGVEMEGGEAFIGEREPQRRGLFFRSKFGGKFPKFLNLDEKAIELFEIGWTGGFLPLLRAPWTRKAQGLPRDPIDLSNERFRRWERGFAFSRSIPVVASLLFSAHEEVLLEVCGKIFQCLSRLAEILRSPAFDELCRESLISSAADDDDRGTPGHPNDPLNRFGENGILDDRPGDDEIIGSLRGEFGSIIDGVNGVDDHRCKMAVENFGDEFSMKGVILDDQDIPWLCTLLIQISKAPLKTAHLRCCPQTRDPHG